MKNFEFLEKFAKHYTPRFIRVVSSNSVELWALCGDVLCGDCMFFNKCGGADGGSICFNDEEVRTIKDLHPEYFV